MIVQKAARKIALGTLGVLMLGLNAVTFSEAKKEFDFQYRYAGASIGSAIKGSRNQIRALHRDLGGADKLRRGFYEYSLMTLGAPGELAAYGLRTTEKLLTTEKHR